MADVIEKFRVGTNNLVSFTLNQNGSPVPSLENVDEVRIYIGEAVTITRTSNNSNGVDYSQGSGKIVLNPANLTEDLSELKTKRYPVKVRVIDGTNLNGVVYGGLGASDRLYFDVSIPPTV